MKTMVKKGMAGFMTAVMLTGIFTVGQPTVKAEAEAKLSTTKATLCTGEKLNLKLDGAKKVKWKSSKSNVAGVDKNGVVTGKKKGNCVIKASSSGKNFSCKVSVKNLPKDYATVNGKKVKVGKNVKITYKLTAPAPVSDVSARYYFYGDQLQMVTSADDKMRFKTWVFFNGYDEPMLLSDDMLEEYKSNFNGMEKGKEPMQCFHQCCGVNADKSNTQSVPVDCKKGKEFDSFYVKALAHGNYTFKATFEVSNNTKSSKYTMEETIK